MQMLAIKRGMKHIGHKNTDRIIPNSSKYPPRPSVPNGSLKEIVTEPMLSRFQIGPKILLANLHKNKGTEISIHILCRFHFNIHILQTLYAKKLTLSLMLTK